MNFSIAQRQRQEVPEEIDEETAAVAVNVTDLVDHTEPVQIELGSNELAAEIVEVGDQVELTTQAEGNVPGSDQENVLPRTPGDTKGTILQGSDAWETESALAWDAYFEGEGEYDHMANQPDEAGFPWDSRLNLDSLLDNGLIAARGVGETLANAGEFLANSSSEALDNGLTAAQGLGETLANAGEFLANSSSEALGNGLTAAQGLGETLANAGEFLANSSSEALDNGLTAAQGLGETIANAGEFLADSSSAALNLMNWGPTSYLGCNDAPILGHHLDVFNSEEEEQLDELDHQYV